MRKTLLPILCLFFAAQTANLTAQKLDNVWLMGYDYSIDGLRAALDFYWGYPDTTAYYTPFEIDKTNASICDEDGNLLFYTNGVYVAGRDHQLMQGSEDFNLDDYIAEYDLTRLYKEQCALILPFPGHDGKYYLFHLSGRIFNNLNNVQPFRLAYSLIDMAENDGNGAMTLKNQTIVEDTLLYGTLQAVKHGNGRDWWVVVGEYNSRRCYRFLLTPDGPKALEKLDWGVTIPAGINDGQSVFSPDGQQFALTHPITNEVHLWSFDRCLGRFELNSSFSPTKLGAYDDAYGCSFSPNGRYLYITSYLTLHQFDTWADNVPASGEVVAVWDGTYDFIYPTSFARQQLGPDGKIYIAPLSAQPFLGRIAQPDLGGEACMVEQHKIKLMHLTYNNGNTLPLIPYYRTYAQTGSGCDSLPGFVSETKQFPTEPLELGIYPNPASHVCHLQISGATEGLPIKWRIHNANGQLVLERQTTTAIDFPIYLSEWPNGLYSVQARTEKGSFHEKLLVLRN